MIHENHYKALKQHINNLIGGIKSHSDDLPKELSERISVEYYQEAILKLDKRRKKLERHQGAYLKAIQKFNHDYEQVRKTWKKDVICIKRSMGREKNKLDFLGKLID